MEDGSIVEGEHNITDSKLIIKDVFIKKNHVLILVLLRLFVRLI